MSNLEAVKPGNGSLERVLIAGDLKALSEEQRLSYVKQVCDSVGLNFITRPFEFITLNGKLTLYAKRDATDQLRRVHNVSVSIVNREKLDDLYVVTAAGKTSDGRVDEAIGAVNISNLKGENLANAMMKAETKAKRRVTLSICGLGLLDEAEVSDIRAVNEAQTEKLAQLKSTLDETTERPAFEAEIAAVEKEQTTGDYVFKTGAGKRKGKAVGSFPNQYLLDTLAWFDGEKKNGKTFPQEVEEDMFYIKAHLESGNEADTN